MKGSITHDVRSGCKCGGEFSSLQVFDVYKVPKCNKCGKFPEKFRVIRYLPGVGKKHIRFFAGKRISDPFAAIYCMKRIDEEIEQGTFNITSYLSNDELEKRTFEVFTTELINYRDEKVSRGEMAFEGHRRFKSLVRNHLMAYFGKMRIDTITSVVILAFQSQIKGTKDTESKALSVLRTILNEAFRLGVISVVPYVSGIKKTNHRENDFISIESQQKIISNVKNKEKRAALRLGSIFALRPCEIRALKWKDLDFVNEYITIERHFSGKHLLDGRKSQGSNCPFAKLRLPFIKIDGMMSVSEVFQDMGKMAGKKEDFVFQTKNKRPYCEKELYKQWVNSYNSLGFDPKDRPDMYSGTRHVTATALLNAGVPLEVVQSILGQTSVLTTKRYAKASIRYLKECVEGARANVAEGKVINIKRKIG